MWKGITSRILEGHKFIPKVGHCYTYALCQADTKTEEKSRRQPQITDAAPKLAPRLCGVAKHYSVPVEQIGQNNLYKDDRGKKIIKTMKITKAL